MILPGISGSFILVLLGMYATVLTAVKSLDILFLAVFAVGAAAGLLAVGVATGVIAERVVVARTTRADREGLPCVRGHEEDGDPRMLLAECAGQLTTVHARHEHIPGCPLQQNSKTAPD